MPGADAFTTEIVRNALSSVAEEMTMTVVRAARSPALREAGDLSSAVSDADGNLIAQGKDLPIHLGVMASTAGALMDRVGRETLKSGDIWIVNLPGVGGNHLPDVKVIRPIFCDGTLVAFAISLAHWADVGGGAPGSYLAAATDIWQEGIQIPPVRIYSDDKPVGDVIALIMSNVRGADERNGDLLAQIAAVRTADRRISELVSRFGHERFAGSVRNMLDATERQMRAVIDSIPDGTLTGEDWLDGRDLEGGQVRIAVEVEIRGSEIRLDFSASDDAVKAPLNTTPSVVIAGVDFVLKMLGGANMLHTSASLRPVTIVTRHGSVLNPARSEPVAAGNHETSQRVVDAVLDALSKVIPERICAGGCGSGGVMILSAQETNGRWWTLYETHGGGEGGNAHRPGASATRVYLSNMMNTPAEFIEAAYPVRVVRSSLRKGSGGAGKHRGGDGLVREYEVLADEAFLTATFERRLTKPKGLLGGEDGSLFSITIRRGNEDIEVPSVWNGKVIKGDRIVVETAGGGGYGAVQ